MDEFQKVGSNSKQYYSLSWIARNRYRRHPRTVWRWRRDPRVGFPPPDLTILDREYWTGQTLDEFDASKRAGVCETAA